MIFLLKRDGCLNIFVNFKSPDLKKGIDSVKDKLDEGISLGDITDAINIPQLSEFSKLAEGLLPSNLVKFGEDGKVSLLSLTELQQSLNNGLEDIKGYLEGEILGLFESIKGEVQNTYNEAKQVYNEISNLGNALSNPTSEISNAAISALNDATGLNLNAQSIGSLYKTATNTIESFSKLSPKKIKELTNPEFFKKVVDTTLDSALTMTGINAELNAAESLINDQLDSSAYLNLHSENISKKSKKEEEKGEDFAYSGVVERRVYWGKGEGSTPEAAAQKSSSGAKLVSDYSLKEKRRVEKEKRRRDKENR